MSLVSNPLSRPAGHRSAGRLRRDLALSLVVACAAAAMAGHAIATLFGLGAAYLAGTAASVAGIAALALRGLDGHGHDRWGGANRVTLGRGVLVALVAAALVVPTPGPGAQWLLAVIAITALALDGVDGWMARRHGLASDYGARFDMELDTLFTLVMALLLWRWGEAGPWVLLTGLLRYLFVVAGWLWPALAAPLPFSQRRRVACALSVGVLAAGLTPLVVPPLTGIAVAAALGLLLFSFAVDTVWLVRRARAKAPDRDPAPSAQGH